MPPWHGCKVAASDMASAFALVLRAHRKTLGLSQEELAERADIHPTYVGLIERFERNPSLNIAQSLSKALGVSLSELIKEAEGLRSSPKKH